MLYFTVVLVVKRKHMYDSQVYRVYSISNGHEKSIYLFEEEVVGEVVEHHGVTWVDGVGPGQELHSVLDGIRLLVVEL